MKKAQLYSQIFVYILTIVLISFILVYGYNAIQNFKNRAEQISCLKFENDLKNAVEDIISDFGSVKRKNLQLCSGYSQVCFVETFERINNKQNPIANVDNLNPIVKDSIKDSTGKNAFLVDGNSFYVGNISVDSDVLCISSKNNQISLRLEGKGNHVLISEWG